MSLQPPRSEIRAEYRHQSPSLARIRQGNTPSFVRDQQRASKPSHGAADQFRVRSIARVHDEGVRSSQSGPGEHTTRISPRFPSRPPREGEIQRESDDRDTPHGEKCATCGEEASPPPPRHFFFSAGDTRWGHGCARNGSDLRKNRPPASPDRRGQASVLTSSATIQGSPEQPLRGPPAPPGPCPMTAPVITTRPWRITNHIVNPHLLSYIKAQRTLDRIVKGLTRTERRND